MAQYNFATANLSFAFALGDKNAGSEAKWTKKILKEAEEGETPEAIFRERGPREKDLDYLQARSKDVMNKIVDNIANGNIDAIGLQELNESDEYGHEYIKNLLAEKGTVMYQHERIILGSKKVKDLEDLEKAVRAADAELEAAKAADISAGYSGTPEEEDAAAKALQAAETKLTAANAALAKFADAIDPNTMKEIKRGREGAKLDVRHNTSLTIIPNKTEPKKKYCMISLTVQVQMTPFPIKPTVALIYDINKFGKPIWIEGGDFTQVSANKGRPMLGVRTDNGFVLMVMHAPNVNPFLFGRSLGLTMVENTELKQYYADPNIKLDKKIRKKINDFIQSDFMDPMEKEISKFIENIGISGKEGKGLKKVLMGDMNDTNPNKPNSLSDWLKKNEGLQFSVPKHGTCCYNWDSSNSPLNGNPTQWLIGENSHPHTGMAKKDPRSAVAAGTAIAGLDSKALAEKAQLKNYDFKGDLIYYSENLVPVKDEKGEKQRELFPQKDTTLTSQYSDHVFQVITLEDKGSTTVGGRKRTLKRKRKKTRKHKHKRKMTKRKKMKKRRSRKHRSR